MTAQEGTQVACDPSSKRHRLPATPRMKRQRPQRDTGCLRLNQGKGVRAAAQGRAPNHAYHRYINNSLVRRTPQRPARIQAACDPTQPKEATLHPYCILLIASYKFRIVAPHYCTLSFPILWLAYTGSFRNCLLKKMLDISCPSDGRDLAT